MSISVNYYQDLFVVITYHCLASLSILFSVFLISVYIIYKKFRNPSFELVVYLSITVIITNLSYIINYMKIVDDPPEVSSKICNAQAILMTTGEIGNFITTTVISYSIYRNIVILNKAKRTSDYIHDQIKSSSNSILLRIFTITFGIIIPFVISIIFFFIDIYGKSYHWCWLGNKGLYSDYPQPTNIKYVETVGIVYYSCLWFIHSLNIVFMFMTIYELKKNSDEAEYVNNFIMRLIQFPLISIFLVFPQTLSKFIITQNHDNNIILQSISVCFLTLQGIIYTLSYGFNKNVRRKFYELVVFIFCCTKPRRESDDSQESSRDSIDTLGETRKDKERRKEKERIEMTRDSLEHSFSPGIDMLIENEIMLNRDSLKSKDRNEELVREEFK